MNEEFSWIVSCGICDTDTDIKVYDEDEKPSFCPMCGDSCITVEAGE